jgi:hypothetical protein
MTSLRWVSNTDILSIGVKPSRVSSFHERFGNPYGLHAEGRLADFITRQIGFAPFAQDDEEFT